MSITVLEYGFYVTRQACEGHELITVKRARTAAQMRKPQTAIPASNDVPHNVACQAVFLGKLNELTAIEPDGTRTLGSKPDETLVILCQ